MTPYSLPPLDDRRCHESIRMTASLIALQVRQGYFPGEHGDQIASGMGIPADVLNRAIEACK